MQFNVEEEKPDLSVSQCRPAQDDGEAPYRTAGYGRRNGDAGPPDLAKLDNMTDADFAAYQFHFTDE